jgi:Zn-dependent protease
VAIWRKSRQHNALTHLGALTTLRPIALRPPGPSVLLRVGCRATSFAKPTLHFQDLLLFVPVLLFSVIAHEYAHGYAALKQGDTTALMLGRLTWNPVKHIDPFMTVLLPAMLYFGSGGKIMLGGAKPVPVNPANYRNFRRGDIIVSLAGVFVNLLIAIASIVLFVLIGLIGRAVPATDSVLGVAQAMMMIGVRLNLLLLAFNLIPIPPLDGSHVIKHVLPPTWAAQYERFGRFGIVILIVILYAGGSFLTYWLRPALALEAVLLRWASPFALSTLGQWLT